MRYLLMAPCLVAAMLLVAPPAWAQEAASPATVQGGEVIGIPEISAILNLSDEDPRTIAVRLINVALGFLAIITVVMVLWGGFQFLLSGGNEEKTARAGATIRNAIIGLIIILSSWAVVQYALEQLVTVTTAN